MIDLEAFETQQAPEKHEEGFIIPEKLQTGARMALYIVQTVKQILQNLVI